MSESESESESERNAPTAEEVVNFHLSWYLRLYPRTLDLVGDYAGNERFIVEGDSLLRHCFEDSKIDLTAGARADGFQLLHAAYEVERFLESLVRRLCNFHIVFFDSNEILCIPPHGSPKSHRHFYLLARSVILRHLTSNLPKSHPDIEIHRFRSVHDPAFREYLESSGVYFAMCHDGATRTPPESRTRFDMFVKFMFRRMIRYFILSGFNVALINGLDVRDTKVMAMVVEGKRGRVSVSGDPPVGTQSLPLKTYPERYSGDLTERLDLVLRTLEKLLVATPDRVPLASAFLLHSILLGHIPLSARRLKEIKLVEESALDYRGFLADFALEASYYINHPNWSRQFDGRGSKCDVVDLVDGRLFKTVLFAIQGRVNAATLLPKEVLQEFDSLSAYMEARSGIRLHLTAKHDLGGKALVPEVERNPVSILAFSNAVFNRHLGSIQIEVDLRESVDPDDRSARIFREITHWHNSKRPIDKIEASKIHDAFAKKRLLKANQRYMGEMLKYAASLTNASGKILERQIITFQKDIRPSSSSVNANAKKPDAPSDIKKGRPGGKKPTSGARELAQASINIKRDVLVEKAFSSWSIMRETLDKIAGPEARYQRTKTYSQDLPTDKQKILNAEITLYNLQHLLEIWAGFCRADKREDGYKIAALIWDQIQRLWGLDHGLTKTVVTHALEVSHLLGIPADSEILTTAADRPLTFPFKTPPASSYSLSVGLSPREFQLLHCGPYMDRNMDSRSDPRVPFKPDGWQCTVLDELDANHSVFVVAPTSAGKTFISFYAMEKVLRGGDDGVLVYVAPTKALVNQIAAEIEARFSKAYKHGGKSVWAIHTRDYRVNNSTGCQVLVTLPAILQIMLLAPSNARSWAPRVRRIIFDEIHSIGQAEDGVIWEQLLLLAPCPIIALSATVGNPEQFNDWLTSTQRSSKFKLTMIQHQHRYSDLRKFMYNPPKQFTFTGLGKKSMLGAVGLDGVPGFQFFHPVASLINKSRGIPADLALEPRDCLILWRAMAKHQTTEYPVPPSLDPKVSCPPTIAKVDIIAWEKELKKLLSSWMLDSNSPFDKVLHDLLTPLETGGEEPPSSTNAEATKIIDSDDLCTTSLPLITNLHERGALPAILFNYDRSQCESIAQSILGDLERAEASWKKTSPRWKSLLEGYEKWKSARRKEPSRAAAKSKKKSNKDADVDGERVSKVDMERESGERERSQYETFDPEAPYEEFSFADMSKVEGSEMKVYFDKLKWRGVVPWLFAALTRGIGVHHAGMNRKYRQTLVSYFQTGSKMGADLICRVEILFRKGYLRVVIATGTLALGINMPCKTVVFSGDSVYLTALNFRQGAGRAGRRGFDILGNVVFHGIPLDKACRLLSSRLPDLNGHFPMTTTLVLRLFALLHESKESEYSRRVVNSLLSQPRLYLGGESFKDQVLHHVRFSIEYLRRQRLLGSRGEPINFTSCVTHLFFTENSSFAFHALLKAGYFHDLCANIEEKPQLVLRQLMLVMSHLFGRRPCRQSDREFVEEIVRKSPSVVFLPPLPEKAAKVLHQHNKETLETFTTYVKTFAKQHLKSDDRTLPLTGLKLGGSTPAEALDPLPATTARSHFVALSGHSDTFTSIADLCSSTRSGIFLEKSVIPQLDIQSDTPLNAYLYDYFMHGAVQPLETANGIRRGDIWFLLNDFSLVLATIVTSLTNFMKLDRMDDDAVMADIAGQGDEMEEVADEKAEEAAEGSADKLSSSKLPIRSKSPEPVRKIQQKKKEAVPDTWEGEEDIIADKEETAAAAADEESWGDSSEKSDVPPTTEDGLLNVLQAFKRLKGEFDEKFRAMWA
ncbi:hypothetical protein FGG08_003846 [Glutinoglossum americanum]|uniref:Helicase ATP-binding domain-containing protein n=1 Tax=Glutinoglossum americanum TaxID=1670608 RepID=A0A9P8IA98_9PEZI|nr:hypothetical protein FGG08_003846 [Glutinoglossum americanum]